MVYTTLAVCLLVIKHLVKLIQYVVLYYTLMWPCNCKHINIGMCEEYNRTDQLLIIARGTSISVENSLSFLV